MRYRLALTGCAFALLACLACDSARDAAREQYLKALEKVGIEKRDVLVKRVEKAKDAQVKAQTQFKDALEEFRAFVGYKGGELESRYDKLSGEYENAVKRADDVHDKIRGVKGVAGSLFKEWETEIAQYTDAALASESRRELEATSRKYADLVKIMEKAASKMDPVLAKLHDQVLYLKHHLNARVVGSLRGTADQLQTDVTKLIEEMQTSINEADGFIREMNAEKKAG